jgi:hypothetical protein
VDMTTLLSAIVTVVGGLIGAFLSRRQSMKIETQGVKISLRQTTELLDREIAQEVGETIAVGDLELTRTDDARPTSATPNLRTTVRDEVDRSVDAFRRRLESIEERFPDTDVVDKIANVNDAILATKLEELQRAVERLEKRLNDEKVSKWDVATIVFTILAALGGLVGAVFGIIKFVAG